MPPPTSFRIRLTGYDIGQVKRYLAELTDDGRPPARPPEFDVVVRSYDRQQVGDLLQPNTAGLLSPSDGAAARPEFDVVVRGYDRRQVGDLLRRHGEGRARPGGPPALTVAFRGYDRRQVDAHLARLSGRSS